MLGSEGTEGAHGPQMCALLIPVISELILFILWPIKHVLSHYTARILLPTVLFQSLHLLYFIRSQICFLAVHFNTFEIKMHLTDSGLS